MLRNEKNVLQVYICKGFKYMKDKKLIALKVDKNKIVIKY